MSNRKHASAKSEVFERELADAGPEVALDPEAAARAARLRYVSDRQPGIRRIRTDQGFVYKNPDGSVVSDEATIARIRKLAIPPAYEDVWVCRNQNGHLQAVGRDARGRKQYRYHPRWRQVRDEAKYGKMLLFGQNLPVIRRRVEQDLARSGLPREKVLATVVRLLEKTLARVGNEEYAKANNSFGLTTLRNRHARVQGARIEFKFRGKHGIMREIELKDRRLAAIVKRLQDMPGQELFQYIDSDGQPHSIGSEDVNDYLREITGEEITAKDFRTWAGTNLAALALRELEEFDSEAKRKKNVVRAVEAVAKMLGNTPAICRKCYIHPAIFEGYLDGSLLEGLKQRADAALDHKDGDGEALTAEEAALAGFLSRRLGEAIDDPERRRVKT